jgi:hypothetical protein
VKRAGRSAWPFGSKAANAENRLLEGSREAGEAAGLAGCALEAPSAAPIDWRWRTPPTATSQVLAFRAVTINRSFATSRQRRTRLVLEL